MELLRILLDLEFSLAELSLGIPFIIKSSLLISFLVDSDLLTNGFCSLHLIFFGLFSLLPLLFELLKLSHRLLENVSPFLLLLSKLFLEVFPLCFLKAFVLVPFSFFCTNLVCDILFLLLLSLGLNLGSNHDVFHVKQPDFSVVILVEVAVN